MFTPKANSKQKRLKKMQEHEKGYAATRLLAVAGDLMTSTNFLHS